MQACLHLSTTQHKLHQKTKTESDLYQKGGGKGKRKMGNNKSLQNEKFTYRDKWIPNTLFLLK